MKCPHCDKEVFSKSYDVSDLYEEPKELTREEQLEAENEKLSEQYNQLHIDFVATKRQLEEEIEQRKDYECYLQSTADPMYSYVSWQKQQALKAK